MATRPSWFTAGTATGWCCCIPPCLPSWRGVASAACWCARPSAKAAAAGLTIVPLCPFASDWLKRHPDVAAQAKVDFG